MKKRNEIVNRWVREKQPTYIEICPECGSTNIEHHSKGQFEVFPGEGEITVYSDNRCRNCGLEFDNDDFHKVDENGVLIRDENGNPIEKQ